MHDLVHAPRPARRVRRGALAALLTLGLLVPAGASSAATAPVPTTEPAPAAAGWIAERMAADDDPWTGTLSDAILAYAASGSARDAGDAALAQLEEVAEEAAGNPGQLSKMILAVRAQGGDPTEIGDFDAIAALHATIVTEGPETGRVGTFPQLFTQSLAVLALQPTPAGAPTAVVDYLADRACPNGGFGWGSCDTIEIDTTAVAAQALDAAGRPVDAQIDFLLDAQQDDGSWLAFDEGSTNATAFASQFLRSVGEVEAADDGAAFVASLQRGCDVTTDRGAVRAYPGSDADLWISTTQAPFAWSAPLHELDASTSAPETAYLDCAPDGYEGAFCPTADGVSVVVDFTVLDPAREPVVACVTEVPDGASGLDLLELAGFDPTTQDFGGDLGEALCAIEDLPELPAGQCFGDGYWSYWNAARPGDWTEYQVGAGSTTPTEGTVEGFAWAGTFPADPPRVTVPGFDTVEPPLPTPPYDRGIAAACPGSYPSAFADIAGSVHAPAIRCLAAAEVTQGTSDPSRYAPRREVTRAQLASFLARAYEQATGAALPAGPDRFPDDDGSPHERNIDALAQAGVVAGVGDGSRFAPNDTVTRGQMASLLARFLDLLDDGAVNGSFPPATDADVFGDDDGSVHEGPIDRLAVQGVVQGRRDGTYGWQASVTRDQLASFLARALDLAVSRGLADPVA
ncbi:S-layer homology domain-containing protein [Nitriliruptoraceae bacterium ZYF776]|nr:S-layer homology domain-containing protein [Profundirhabdus halotolerans]